MRIAAKGTEITQLRAQVSEQNNTIATLYGLLEQSPS
jgi:hypothetical protein